ncbi:M23 family metallopeptidase [Nocardioides sp. GCM10027113]|uniref:M23 family metallopeptidase n=1 Tax=unclassified Nocardioides TaxID=2615069 RepID=UPI003613FEA4
MPSPPLLTGLFGLFGAGLPGLALVVMGPAASPWPSTPVGPGEPSPAVAAPAAGAVTGTPAPAGVWPLRTRPEVHAGFSPPLTAWGAGHRGVDLVGEPGQPVRAALPGRVSWAGPLAGRGVVVVDHGATRTTYEPVTAEVPVGASVAAGDRLGTLAAPGSHCAPRTCLHWGWIRGETYLDPLRLVGLGPVRLLPLWR